MKKYLCFVFVSLILCSANADQEFGIGDWIVPYFDDQNVIVSDGAVLTGPGGVINVDYAPVYLYNSGTINGTINTDGNNLFVYNKGTISGTITGGGNVVQIMRSDAEVTNIDVAGASFSVEVCNINNLNFDAVKTMGASAFTIKESSVVINDFQQWQNWGKTVNFEGPVILIINDKDTVHSGDVINHVSKTDNVSVQIVGLDDLYKVELGRNGEDIILYIVRETDYDKIDGDTNSVLEEIRNIQPDDKLFKALDLATNDTEINRLKDMSYHFNHNILLRPVKTTINFSTMNMMLDETDFGLGIIPFYSTSDSIKNYGGRVYAGNRFDNFYLNVGLNLNNFTYKDDLNDFSGMSYGFDIKSKQIFNNLWFGETLGLVLTKYNAKYVYKDDGVTNNPIATSWYGAIDAGYDINFEHGFSVTPLIGLGFQKYDVVDVSESDFYMRVGANGKYSFVVDGIKYEYSLFSSMASNGNLYTALKMGFWSITDNAGVSVGVGVLKDDFDYNYQLSANAKMLF